MSQSIEVVISPSGKTSIKSAGFFGSSCQQATEFLEKALGEVQGEQRTAEYYQTSAQHLQVRDT